MSDILDALGWLLDRSQQGLFQGSKAYADNTARNYQYLNKDVGLTPALSGSLAGTASLAPAAWAAVQGLSGGGKRVDGTELSEGFTENPRIDNAIGQGLNVTADPATPFYAWSKFGAAGKTLNDLAGTAKRTWQSIQGTKKINPELVGQLDQRLGNAWSKYGLDVPAAPRYADEPLAVRTVGSPAELGTRMGYTGSGGMPLNADATRGFSTPDMNMVAYKTSAQDSTLPHEMRHWAYKTLPDALRDAASSVYSGFEQAFPAYSAGLRKSPQYANKDAARFGDEIFAREADKILGLPDYGGSTALNYVQDRAMRALQPEMFRDAAPLGVSNVPTGINILEALQDYLAGSEEMRR